MSKQYGVTIIGPDSPASWLTAAAMAGTGEKVALILDRAPDPEIAPFPWLPFLPMRNSLLARAAGLHAMGRPPRAFEPDFQVITEEGTIDFIADPGHWARGLEREFQGMTSSFLDRCSELDRMAEEVENKARGKGFPYRGAIGGARPLVRMFSKVVRWTPPPSPPFSEWAQGMTLGQNRTILAAAAAALGAPLSADAPVLHVALLWRLIRSLHQSPGATLGLREQVGEKIGGQGIIATAAPEAAIVDGRVLRAVRIKGGTVIDAKVLIAGRRALGSLLGVAPESRARRGGLVEFSRVTFFYKLERRSIPDSLAPRAVVVRDLTRPLIEDNLFVLCRSRRVPARETLAVTMLAPPPGLEPEHGAELLAAALPWLDRGALAIDDTRPPLIRSGQAQADPLAAPAWPNLNLENVFPLPDDAAPGWGAAGPPVAVESLTAAVKELLVKYNLRPK